MESGRGAAYTPPSTVGNARSSWEVQAAMTEIAPRIVVDEAIQGGRPVIQGTRVPVDVVIGKLAGGMSQEDVEREYGLVREDVLAALAYAARSLSEERVRAVR